MKNHIIEQQLPLISQEHTSMKAISVSKYGSADVLQLIEVPKPMIKDNELLVKLVAAPVTRADAMMRQGVPKFARLFLGLRRPKNPIPGTGFAGEVEAIGKDVSLFKVGDQVFGETTLGFGTHAEYISVAENGLILPLPSKMTHAEAAPVCDGPLTAWNFLKEVGKVQPGQHILINGASGSIGTAAVQLAKQLGASVTGVCSGKNVELVRSLGADHVIDYTQEDFTQQKATYDIIFDTVGTSNFLRAKKALKPSGIFLSPVLSMPDLFLMVWTSLFGKKKVKFSATGLQPLAKLKPFLQELRDLIEAGKLHSVMDKSYTLEEAVKANRYVDSGRKKGNVVIEF